MTNAVLNNVNGQVIFNTSGPNAFTNAVMNTLNNPTGLLNTNFATVNIVPVYAGPTSGGTNYFSFSTYLTQ